MSFCTNCGTGLPPDTRFCPKCGSAVAATAAPVPPAPPKPPVPETTHTGAEVPVPPPASSPVHEVARAAARPVPPPPPAASRAPQGGRKRGGLWWIGPAAVVGLVILAAIFLTFLPLDRDEPRSEPEATETIAEGEPAQQPPESGTLIEVGGPDDDGDSTGTVNTTTIAPPPGTATVPPATASVPPPPATKPSATMPPASAPARTPAPSGPVADNRPPQRAPAAEPSRPISSSDAAARLRGYVTSTRYYGVANECVRVEPRDYRNVGYNMEVWHSCAGSGGQSRLLGRWRVDAKTGEVFRRRDDGRYLKP